MSGLSKKCLIDTNVPKTANLAQNPAQIPDELVGCVQACVDAVDHVMNKGKLVLDSGDEIYHEYLSNLCLSGRKGFGNAFMKWVHDHQWDSQKVDHVTITKNGDSYDQFPDHDGLVEFDNSDRKFIAVSNAHSDKPPVLQATDSKWWGWKDPLAAVGIVVHFLCPDYAKAKYAQKMGM
jgi:hypothetical protein